jgi:hypothetical protein
MEVTANYSVGHHLDSASTVAVGCVKSRLRPWYQGVFSVCRDGPFHVGFVNREDSLARVRRWMIGREGCHPRG